MKQLVGVVVSCVPSLPVDASRVLLAAVGERLCYLSPTLAGIAGAVLEWLPLAAHGLDGKWLRDSGPSGAGAVVSDLVRVCVEEPLFAPGVRTVMARLRDVIKHGIVAEATVPEWRLSTGAACPYAAAHAPRPGQVTTWRWAAPWPDPMAGGGRAGAYAEHSPAWRTLRECGDVLHALTRLQQVWATLPMNVVVCAPLLCRDGALPALQLASSLSRLRSLFEPLAREYKRYTFVDGHVMLGVQVAAAYGGTVAAAGAGVACSAASGVAHLTGEAARSAATSALEKVGTEAVELMGVISDHKWADLGGALTELQGAVDSLGTTVSVACDSSGFTTALTSAAESPGVMDAAVNGINVAAVAAGVPALGAAASMGLLAYMVISPAVSTMSGLNYLLPHNEAGRTGRVAAKAAAGISATGGLMIAGHIAMVAAGEATLATAATSTLAAVGTAAGAGATAGLLVVSAAPVAAIAATGLAAYGVVQLGRSAAQAWGASVVAFREHRQAAVDARKAAVKQAVLKAAEEAHAAAAPVLATMSGDGALPPADVHAQCVRAVMCAVRASKCAAAELDEADRSKAPSGKGAAAVPGVADAVSEAAVQAFIAEGVVTPWDRLVDVKYCTACAHASTFDVTKAGTKSTVAEHRCRRCKAVQCPCRYCDVGLMNSGYFTYCGLCTSPVSPALGITAAATVPMCHSQAARTGGASPFDEVPMLWALPQPAVPAVAANPSAIAHLTTLWKAVKSRRSFTRYYGKG